MIEIKHWEVSIQISRCFFFLSVALMKGAHILRVHDVREAVEAVRITEKLKIESGYDK